MSAHILRKRARTDSDDVKEEPTKVDAPGSLTGHSESESPAAAAANSVNWPAASQSNHRRLERIAPELQHDAEFWFSDGNIILIARDVEFRVYRGLLAEHSPVFKTMFAADHPHRLVQIDESHQAITCPVVRLTDSPEDLRHILRAFVPRKPMRFFEETKPSFHQISAYMRLGQEYELNELYDQSRQLLKLHYTDNLETWVKSTHWEPSEWGDDSSIGVVNLARLINDPSLLPTALMGCVYMEQEIVQGFEREDGTHEMLALADLGRCFRASRLIREAHVTGIVRTFEETVSPGCTKEKHCKAILRQALRKVEEKIDWLMKSGPFMSFDALVRNVPKELATCGECTAMVRERYGKECEAFWARLPELLDIEVPGWPQAAVVAEEAA